MRGEDFIGGIAEDATGAAADALREVLGRVEKAIAVLDAEAIHQHDLVHLLREFRLQVVVVLRSAFDRGLDTAFAVAEAMRESDGSGMRVLAAPWGESPFPCVALVASGTSDGAYRLMIGRSGRGESPLNFATLVDVDHDIAVAVDEWFMQMWDISTALDRVRELEQPVFERARPEVVAELATRWDRFVADVRAGHEPAAQPGGDLQSTDAGDEPDHRGNAQEDPLASWTLFPIDAPGSPVELQEESVGAAEAASVGGRSSILALRPSSPLERDLREIYARGVLVSVHTSHKVPTFRFDVNAALGISEHARSGRASLRSPIRLDLLPTEVSKEIERSKRFASNVMRSHSIGMAKNQHWMPLRALPYFEAALEVKAEPKTLSVLLGKNIEDYVKANLSAYVQWIVDVFSEQQFRYEFDQVTVDQLGVTITDYLRQHETVSVTTSYTKETLGFSGVTKGDYTRPFKLLLTVAKISRRNVMADDSRKRVIPAPPVEVWDVVGGDKLLSSHGTYARTSARDQFVEIEKIADAGASAENCEALIHLMRSEPELT